MSRNAERYAVDWANKAPGAQCAICDAPLTVGGGVRVQYRPACSAYYCLTCISVLSSAAQTAPVDAVQSAKRRVAKLYVCDSHSTSSSPPSQRVARPKAP